ncbi:MAG: protein-L-isoaspartate(D-aspartate) O-methyltransferase [Candidatus Thermoplasmatota archaeon]|nr:protein-L-isoaspartate(D-aspartate) O-methyltransferase [Candidatus Thermoplasmatota archaeon]
MREGDRYTEKRTILVDKLLKGGEIRSDEVRSAMLSVPRELFVPDLLRMEAYHDRPLPIGNGQTISAPHMVAIMAEEMNTRPGHKVLEIGTGSGYHAAVISRLILPGGHIFTIERVEGLAIKARRNLDLSGIDNVTVVEGDGSVGLPEQAPFDRIYYTCAAPDIPASVLDQLSDDGSLLGVVGRINDVQRLVRFSRQGSWTSKELLTHCVFVPLIGELGY